MHRQVMYDGGNIFGLRTDVLDAMSIYSPTMHKSFPKKSPAGETIKGRLKSCRQKVSAENSQLCVLLNLNSPSCAILSYAIQGARKDT